MSLRESLFNFRNYLIEGTWDFVLSMNEEILYFNFKNLFSFYRTLLQIGDNAPTLWILKPVIFLPISFIFVFLPMCLN